jgi:hypothetical protein
MRIQYRKVLGALAAAALAASMLGGPVAAQDDESAQVILDWNMNSLAANAAAKLSPSISNLTLAMVHAAMFDAVNSIVGGYQSYLEPLEAPADASKVAAAATAAHDVLAAMFPDQAADFDTKLEASLGSVADGAAKDAGIAVGQAAAAAILTARDGDGRGVANPIPIGTEAGQWRPTPPENLEYGGSWIAKVKPFLAGSSDEYRTAGPRALDSAEYAAEFDEVKALGAAEGSSRTPEQDAIAAFWVGAIPQWAAVERSIATDQGLGIADAARLFALANLAAADAAIGCFNDKYNWMLWRPVTAIHEAADDGNDATEADPDWASLLPAPPYPDHPSGFNCLTGAHVGAIRGFLGTDEVTFTVPSMAEGGEPITYTTLQQAADEVIEARILQGIHFRSAEVQGQEIGAKAAALATERLAPVD